MQEMTAAYSMTTTSIAMEDNSSTTSISNYTYGQHVTYMAYVTTFTAVLAIILNILSMLATLHVPGKLTSHLKYILSLSISDILLALTTTSSSIHLSLLPDISSTQTENLHSECAKIVIILMTNISILATQFSLIAMAFDHYIAIDKPLHYRNKCSKGNGNVVIILVWSAASIISLTNVPIGMIDFNHKKSHHCSNFCECTNRDEYFVEYIIYGTTIVCLIMITAIYGKIFCNVKNLSSDMQEPRQRNWLQNRKALATTLLIVGSFFMFYLPHCFFQTGLLIIGEIDEESLFKIYGTLPEISDWLFLMQIFNSLCDPIIYALRLKEVQCGYKIMRHKVQRLILCSQHHHYRYSYQSTTSSRSRTGSAISEGREQNYRFSLTSSHCIPLESSSTKNTTGNPTMLCNHGDC